MQSLQSQFEGSVVRPLQGERSGGALHCNLGEWARQCGGAVGGRHPWGAGSCGA